jgi:hypothetical protein
MKGNRIFMKLLMRKPSLLMILLLASGLIILIVVLPLLAYHFLAPHSKIQQPGGGNSAIVNSGQQYEQSSSPISRGVPAFASSAFDPAANANDDNYNSTWRSQGAPAWLVYDLSRVPAVQRSRVVVAWYNESGNYDHTIINYPTYNMPQDYTIDVNAGPEGGQPPVIGWVTQVRVRGNHYHSRQHIVNMAGYNWLRIDVTAVDGSTGNYDASINMDVFDARTALTDDWIFYGDSITAGAMGHQTLNGVNAFAQLIREKSSNHYPVQESGGIGFLTSADGVKYLHTWLGMFSGKYVGLSYGTNDALGCVSPDEFYNNYAMMVRDVLDAGKIPLVPRIPWGGNANIQNCAPALNAKIDALYQAFPQLIRGPDLWAFFQSHQDLISNDTIHPSDAGLGAYRQQWANSVLTTVYSHM